jgi:aspartyl-tRNA(Asn)/glutamyl-tRNA(Gln) amidotransferase subunit A
MSSDFDYMSATSLRKLIVGKQISPVELVERALSKAASTQADLNCFFVIDAEGARAAASEPRPRLFRERHWAFCMGSQSR